MFEIFQDLYQSFKSLSTIDILKRVAIVLITWFFQSLMMFAMNFMLDSFSDSRKNSYTTLLAMAALFLVFAVAFLIVMMALAFFTKYFESGKLAFRNLWDRHHLIQLLLLGLFDCLGGVTGTYAAPNTPIAIQFAILATSVAWTFPFARWLVKDRDRPCTPLVFFSTMLTISGAAVTIVPHWDSLQGMRGVASTIGWIAVFVMAALFPLFLNVLYARYLVTTVDNHGRSIIVVDGGTVSNQNTTFALVAEDGNENQQRSAVEHFEAVFEEDRQEILEHQSSNNNNKKNNLNNYSHENQKPNSNNSNSNDDDENTNLYEDDDQVLNTKSNSAINNNNQHSSNNVTVSNQQQFDPLSPISKKEVAVIASHNWSYFLSKLSIAMVGDAVFQCLFILILFPLDFVPWFGAAANAEESWTWLQTGFYEIYHGGGNQNGTHHQNDDSSTNMTPVYFVLYTVGFFFSHFLGASLSYYSPQLTAFIYSVNTPINLLILAFIPQWNVFGEVAPAWASVTSIILTAIGAFTYAAWEHGERIEQRKRAEQEQVTKSTLFPVDEDDAKQVASAATMSFS